MSSGKCHIVKSENSSCVWNLNTQSCIGDRSVLRRKTYYSLHYMCKCLGVGYISDKIGTPVAILPRTWPYRVSAWINFPSVSVLWLGETASLHLLSLCSITSSYESRFIPVTHLYVSGTFSRGAMNKQNIWNKTTVFFFLFLPIHLYLYHINSLVIRVSTLRVGDTADAPLIHWSSHTSDLKTGTFVATRPHAIALLAKW